MHVVEAIEQHDTVTGRRSETTIRYHDGVWDGPNREFRGFRAVTVVAGDPTAPVRQEVDFFQGDPDEVDLVERDRQRALAGSSIGTRAFERVGPDWLLRQSSEQHWAARLEHDGTAAGRGFSVWFPHVAVIETREVDPDGPDRLDRTERTGYDAFGNLTEQSRTSFAEGDPPADRDRTREQTTWLADEANWLVHLPVSVSAFDRAEVPFSARSTHYDGDPFVGLPLGQASAGLPTAVVEARLLDARTPADLFDGHDPVALGYLRREGVTPGWYARTQATRRDGRGNPVEQRDPLGAATTTTYDADGVFPLSCTDPAGRSVTFTFDVRSAEPALTAYPDGRSQSSEFDALGRLVSVVETGDAGSQLVKAWALDVERVTHLGHLVRPDPAGHRPRRSAGRRSADPPGHDRSLGQPDLLRRVRQPAGHADHRARRPRGGHRTGRARSLAVWSSPGWPRASRPLSTGPACRPTPRSPIRRPPAPATTPAAWSSRSPGRERPGSPSIGSRSPSPTTRVGPPTRRPGSSASMPAAG